MSGSVISILDASGNSAGVKRLERRGAAVLSSAPALLAAVMMSLAAVAHAQTPPALARDMAYAEKGNPRAEFNLGNAYNFGQYGVSINKKLAEQWYMKSAEQGDRKAEYNLGSGYYNGVGGLPKNKRLAEQWYMKSAEQGDRVAEYDIGVFYHKGIGGLPPDQRLAVSWYKKSAAQNYQPAIQALRALENAPAQPPATVARAPAPRAPSPAPHVAPTPAAPAGATDNQQLDRSLHSFWQAYFQHSNAKLVEFGTPALVRPVNFAGPQ